MKKILMGLGLSSLLALGACGEKAGEDKVSAENNIISCSNAEVTQNILDTVLKNAKQSALANVRNGFQNGEALSAEAIGLITFSVDEIRTDSQTDNKASCLATYTMSVPTATFNQAEQGYRYWLESDGTLLGAIAEMGWSKEGSLLTKSIAYHVQKTDDAQKAVTTLDKPTNVSDGVAFVLTGYVASDSYQKMMDAEDRNEKEWQEREAKLQTLSDEATIAKIKEAKEVNKFAHQNLNAVWNGLPENIRKDMTSLQKAWNEKRESECRYNANANSDNVPEQALAMVQCDTDFVTNRTDVLNEVASRYVSGAMSTAEGDLAAQKSQMQQTWASLPKEVKETLQIEQAQWARDSDATCTSKRSQTANQEASRLIYTQCMAEETKKRIAVLKKYQI